MPNSTIFGSTIIRRTSSGRALNSSEIIREFIQTDLPEPVVPAISRWGSLAISPIMRLPPISLPTAKEIFDLLCSNSLESSTSRARTVLTSRLGTSMPTTEILLGMAEIRTPDAPKDRAISSARLVTLDSLTPRSSSSSYRVTDGPRVTLTICASILKLSSVALRRSVFSRISSVPSTSPPWLIRSRETGGKTYSPVSPPPIAISMEISAADCWASDALTFWGVSSTGGGDCTGGSAVGAFGAGVSGSEMVGSETAGAGTAGAGGAGTMGFGMGRTGASKTSNRSSSSTSRTGSCSTARSPSGSSGGSSPAAICCCSCKYWSGERSPWVTLGAVCSWGGSRGSSTGKSKSAALRA